MVRSEYAANLALQPVDKEAEHMALLCKADAIMHKPIPFKERLKELLELEQSSKQGWQVETMHVTYALSSGEAATDETSNTLFNNWLTMYVLKLYAFKRQYTMRQSRRKTLKP